MRTFTKLREILVTNKELKDKLGELENKITKHDKDIQLIFEAIKKLIEPELKPKRKVGRLNEGIMVQVDESLSLVLGLNS